MYKHDILVRFSECDALGHVNNAMYFTYFEAARTELFRIFNPNLNTRAWNLILASTACDYLQEVVFAEQLTVYTWISRLGTSSFDVEHAIKDSQGQWVARAKAALLMYDFEQKKAIPLTEEIRHALLEHREGPADAPVLRG